MPSPIRTLALAVLLTLAPAATAAPAATPAPLQQLRIYESPRANEGVFHDRFQDHALRIMARHGFAVRSIWRSEHEGKVEFVYLLDWPDAATMKAAWAAFMADPEWAAIKKETGARQERKSGGEGKSVSVRVDPGGGGIIKK